MAVLSWGKPKIEKVSSSGGKPVGDGSPSWVAIDTPKENTTKLTPTAGAKKEAREEGGELVDVRYAKNTFVFEFDIFVKKGSERPFTDVDGVVDGEWAFRLTPEDVACEGIQIDRASVRCEQRYSSEEGIMLHYVCDCLKPASGAAVKPYTQA